MTKSARQAALVTGAARGIGLGAAIALADEGFDVALNDRADSAELDAAADTVRRPGVSVTTSAFDVSDLDAHGPALSAIEDTIGPLTTLVNNAGVSVLNRGDLLDVSQESYDRCLGINAKAMFFLSQAFARRLVGRGRPSDLTCSIINVTSSNARAVAVQRSEYCVSKAAAAMISKAFAVRLGAEDIAVYDVQPGLIKTEMTAPVLAMYQDRIDNEELTLLPRLGTTEEVGAIIASLASGKFPYTTGQVISADAGMLVERY